MEVFIFDAKLVEYPYDTMDAHVFYSSVIPREIMKAINPNVVDFQQERNIMTGDFSSYYQETPNCETRGYFEEFQLSLKNLGLLWVILGFGIIVAFFVKIFNWLSFRYMTKKGLHLLLQFLGI